MTFHIVSQIAPYQTYRYPPLLLTCKSVADCDLGLALFTNYVGVDHFEHECWADLR